MIIRSDLIIATGDYEMEISNPSSMDDSSAYVPEYR